MLFDAFKKKTNGAENPVSNTYDSRNLEKLSLNELGNMLIYQFYKDGKPIPLSPEDEKFIHTSVDTLRAFFKESAIAFDVKTQGTDTKIFHFGMTIQGVVTDVLVAAILNPKMCSIRFCLPFKANPAMEHELNAALMDYNCTRRFGAFVHDKEEDEINYKMDFPCFDGIKKDDFVAAFVISMNSVSKFMDELKRYVIPN